jgi:cutinase
MSRFLCAAAQSAGVVYAATSAIPSAAADGCSDVEVVFARGMGDPVGPGPLGAAFADSLRSKLAGRSVGVYGVNYPADVNFLRVSDGVADATNHIQWLAANCPATKVVLGGFSEGAAVVDILAGANLPGLNAVPALGAIPYVNEVLPAIGSTAPLPADLNDRVAAVAVFGNPLGKVTGPLTAASPVFGARTIDLCYPGDPICSEGKNMTLHHQYVPGDTDQAATFVAGLL